MLLKFTVTSAPACTVIVDWLNARFWAERSTVELRPGVVVGVTVAVPSGWPWPLRSESASR